MNRRLGLVGVIVTCVYVAGVVLFFKIDAPVLQGLKPYELGDFLAGLFGPLAILWLMLGFFQQGRELRDSQKALLLQADELRASVQAQQELGKVTKEALELDRKSRLYAAQPSFALKVVRDNLFEDPRYVAHLRNFGVAAIHLEFLLNDGGQMITATKIGGLGHGAEEVLGWCHPSSSPETETLTVAYVDQTRNSQSISFYINYRDSHEVNGYAVQIFSTVDL